MRKKIYLFSIIIFIIDLLSKLIITNYENKLSITVIDNFFFLNKVTNEGAAFSMFSGFTIFLILIGLFVLFYIHKYLLKEVTTKLEIVGYSFIIGGIIGNLFDRIVYGEVIDFLSFKIFNYYFPIFNLADTFICIGIFLIIISFLKKDKKIKKGDQHDYNFR